MYVARKRYVSRRTDRILTWFAQKGPCPHMIHVDSQFYAVKWSFRDEPFFFLQGLSFRLVLLLVLISLNRHWLGTLVCVWNPPSFFQFVLCSVSFISFSRLTMFPWFAFFSSFSLLFCFVPSFFVLSEHSRKFSSPWVRWIMTTTSVRPSGNVRRSINQSLEIILCWDGPLQFMDLHIVCLPWFIWRVEAMLGCVAVLR